MRRTLILLALFSLALPLMAVNFTFTTSLAVDPGYEADVRSSVERLLAPRLGSDEAVMAHLDETSLLTLSTRYGSLAIQMTDDRFDVKRTLESALLWDSKALVPASQKPMLSYPLSYGYIIENAPLVRQGNAYWVVDQDGKRLGSVRTMRSVEADEPIVVAVQTSGRALLPHLELTKKGRFSYGLYASLTRTGAYSVEATVDMSLGRYPFDGRVAIGYTENEGFTVKVGLASMLYLSHIVGTRTHLGRNLAVTGWADVGIGWADDLYYTAAARIGFAYHLSAWQITAMVGTTVSATHRALMDRDLFFTVGTAYTYTP